MILAAEPDWKELPESTPSRLRELLQKCLAKDVRDRLRDIGDVGLELREIASKSSMSSTDTALPARVIEIRRWKFVVGTIAGLLVASLTTGIAVWSVMRRTLLPCNFPRAIKV